MSLRRIIKLLLMLCTLPATSSLYAGVLLDPTRPATRQKTVVSEEIKINHRSWTLESTLVSSARRIAVINGKLVSEGESVDGARVIRIRKLDVLVQTPSRQLTLKLLPDILKINP